ncbi:MAG: TatD family hydrolase [Phycisphaerales bacterium]|nr:TatD family hydrolase [Phycisphaerales bacterium]
MFDSHCHLTFPGLHDQVLDVLDRAQSEGVRGAITVATGPDDVRRGLELAQRDPRVWCTSGVHPHQAQQEVDWDEIVAIANEPKCVAWGELGLDWHYPDPPREDQFACLHAHLDHIEAARDEGLEMPIVVHCRKSLPDLMEVFKQRSLPPDRYVFHCFTGTPDEARTILDFGSWISFTGVVTFPSAPEVAEAARLVPLDRVMVETDSPYLSPEPLRKVRPNEPAHVTWVAKFLAELHDMSYDEFESIVDANTERFFNITLP